MAVPISDSRVRRRGLLVATAGGLGLAQLGGCKPGADRGDRAGDDPLEPVLAAAVYLADRYQTAMTTIPDLAERLTPLRDSHRTHIQALTRELGTAETGRLPSGRPPTVAPSAPGGTAPSASGGTSAPAGAGTPAPGATESAAAPQPLPKDPAAALADLRALELTGQRQAAAVCLSGARYRAGLVGSIAAARAGHAEALT